MVIFHGQLLNNQLVIIIRLCFRWYNNYLYIWLVTWPSWKMMEWKSMGLGWHPIYGKFQNCLKPPTSRVLCPKHFPLWPKQTLESRRHFQERDDRIFGVPYFCESHMHQPKCIESCSCISAHVALSKSLTSIGKSATGYIQEWYALHQALPITVVSPTRNHPQNHHKWMVNHGPSHGSCLLRNEPQNRHPSAGCKPGAVIMFVMPKIMVTMLRP